MIEIGVVVPSYNHANQVTYAVDSLLQQTKPASEIVVVDDGSTDNTRDRLSKYSGDITYIHQSNRGLSAARNRGIAECHTEWIAFLDADDLWVPHKLEYQASMIEIAQNDVAVVHSRALIKGKDYEIKSPIPARKGDFHLEDLVVHNQVQVPTTVVRRNHLLDVGGFDETLTALEDWDLWLRLALGGYGFRYSSEVLAIYHVSSGAMHMDVHRMEENALRVLGKLFSQPELPRPIRELSAKSHAGFYLGLSNALAARNDRAGAVMFLGKALQAMPHVVISGAFLGSVIRLASPRVLYRAFRRLNRGRMVIGPRRI